MSTDLPFALKRILVRTCFEIAWRGIRWASFASMAVLLITPVLAVLASWSISDPKTQTIALSVTASLLASSLHFILQTALDAIRGVQGAAYLEMYEAIVAKQGILAIHDQRSEPAANAKYGTLIRNARQRIWAFGMTNGKLLSSHTKAILERLRNLSIGMRQPLRRFTEAPPVS